MEPQQLKQILKLHAKWSQREADGSCADLRGAELCYAELRNANLRNANLCGANLHGADLCYANLYGANLRYAELYGADLYGANLHYAELYGANLHGAKNISKLAAAQLSILPETGTIVGWKKCRDGVFVKLIVGKSARRSNATGRKCRAEHVKVLEVIGAEVGISMYDLTTQYRAGQVVRCDEWHPDRWIECGGGIHFFLTRIEAEHS